MDISSKHVAPAVGGVRPSTLPTTRVFGIAGHSGMGKTTLLERLIPHLRAQGLRVSLIKHSHKDIEIDRPGKDSYRLREAGCSEVLLLGRSRWALMHELRDDAEPTLEQLMAHMAPCDLVLVEGFKGGHFPKLEVYRPSLQRPSLWPDWPGIKAIASDEPPPGPGSAPDHWLLLSDLSAISRFVLAHAVPMATPQAGAAPL